MSDGTALFDRLGEWFTLLSFDDAPVDAMRIAAERRRVPLRILRIDEPELAPIYEAPAVLVRPDEHVAWRGAMPRDGREADAIVSRALGWAID